MIAFIEFPHGGEWYDRVLPLRNGVLREPLGLRYTEADSIAERDQWHFALVDQEEPVACLVIAPLGSGGCKLRQMAVATGRQGEGLGGRLVAEVEGVLRDRGIERVELHARVVAVGFYERLGYEAVGEEFLEVTIPHRAMQKRL